MVERQKKIQNEFSRYVAECTVHNLRDTRTRKVLFTYNLIITIRNNWILYGKKWIRHTLRKRHEAIEREALDWNPQGKMRRGRSRHTWRRTVHNEALEKGKSWS
jgi:hypothetical protein